MSTAGSSEGTFPVVVFFPGFACTTPASAYSTVLSHIASWGYVVIGKTRYNRHSISKLSMGRRESLFSLLV